MDTILSRKAFSPTSQDHQPHDSRRLFKSSDALAWSSNGENWTFAQLRTRVEDFKACIDWVKGATAIITAEPGIDFVVRFVAMLELEYPQAVLPAGAPLSQKKEYAALLGCSFCLDEDGSVNWLNAEESTKLLSNTVLVLFTSGSSGSPKGVELSRKNIDASSAAIIESLAFQGVSHQWLQINLHYSFGLLGQLLPALRCGVHTHWLNHMLALVQQLSETKPGGMISGVPSQLLTLCQIVAQNPGATAQVTHVVSAGCYVTESLRQTLHAIFPNATVYLNYGQTEASPRILCLSNNDTKYFSTATGYPVGNLDVKLADDGELLVAGDQIMLGYLGQGSSPVQDGWLHTGDLASIDEQGLVSIQGRKDSVVKISGEKVALVEIERAINGLSEVTSAAVTAIEDSHYGKQLRAVMVFDSKKLSHAQLVAQLGERLSAKKIPTFFYEVADLPKNMNGKLDRKRLVECLGKEKLIS